MQRKTAISLPRDRPGRTECKSRLAVISDAVHQGQPVTRVLYGEGGFTLLDAEMADENPDEHELEEFHVVCLDCLIDQHPEVGAGMDIAKRAGSSRFVEGHGWMEEMQ